MAQRATSESEAPYFDDLAVGQVFDGAPSLTLTSGHAATHQSILGDRLRLSLDEDLATAVTGRGPLAHPGLVWDVSIGQSTLATGRVIANLFYRGLRFRHLPAIGDTLHTRTEVVALRQNATRPDRPRRGVAALHIATTDQRGTPVLDFWRCAMLPLSPRSADTGHDDDLDTVGTDAAASTTTPFDDWNLRAFRQRVPGPHADAVHEGRTWDALGGDVVSNAPELARLTLNLARVHHDETVEGARLVYGGHTIGLALSHISRALPNLVGILEWQHCDHLAPVHEGDTLHTHLAVERTEPGPAGGTLAHLRAQVAARSGPQATARDVLDWRLTALMA